VAANQGAAQAQFNLGWAYHYGLGVDRNWELALKWYSAAAEQVNPGGIRGVGEMYELGVAGLKQDFVQAAKLYERAAELGDLVAQFNLGVFYEHGQGVPVNRRLAETYLERSATQGHDSAQLNLGLLYQSGVEGVPDYKKAIYWLQMAAESGNPKAHGAIGSMYVSGHGVKQDIPLPDTGSKRYTAIHSLPCTSVIATGWLMAAPSDSGARNVTDVGL